MRDNLDSEQVQSKKNDAIATLLLGETRNITFAETTNPTLLEFVSIPLSHGDCLVMESGKYYS